MRLRSVPNTEQNLSNEDAHRARLFTRFSTSTFSGAPLALRRSQNAFTKRLYLLNTEIAVRNPLTLSTTTSGVDGVGVGTGSSDGVGESGNARLVGASGSSGEAAGTVGDTGAGPAAGADTGGALSSSAAGSSTVGAGTSGVGGSGTDPTETTKTSGL